MNRNSKTARIPKLGITKENNFIEIAKLNNTNINENSNSALNKRKLKRCIRTKKCLSIVLKMIELKNIITQKR